MLNFIKKEKKLIIITVLVLILVIAVNSFAIKPEKESVKDNKIKANQAVNSWNNEIEKLYKFYDGKNLALAPPRNHIKNLQEINADAQKKEQALQNVVAFDVKENFKVPKKVVEEALKDEYPELISDFANRKIAELFDETYTKIESAKYKFVRPLNLASPVVQENLAFDVYQQEALPLIGKREEEVNKIENQVEKDIIIAHAEAAMKLVQLNILKVIIENAQSAEITTMDDLKFVQRPSELASKFNVKVNTPQYYRPIVINVKITGNEQSIFDFLRLCIDPPPNSNAGEFLAIHSFLLNNEDVLNPNAQTFDVTAEIKLVAFIIDPNSPFSEYIEPKKRTIIPSYGYGPASRGGAR